MLETEALHNFPAFLIASRFIQCARYYNYQENEEDGIHRQLRCDAGFWQRCCWGGFGSLGCNSAPLFVLREPIHSMTQHNISEYINIQKIMNSYFSPKTIWVVKQRTWAEHVAWITQMLKEYQILDCETDEKTTYETGVVGWALLKCISQKSGCKGVDWIQLVRTEFFGLLTMQ